MQLSHCKNCNHYAPLTNYCLKHKRIIDDIQSCSYNTSLIVDTVILKQNRLKLNMNKKIMINNPQINISKKQLVYDITVKTKYDGN